MVDAPSESRWQPRITDPDRRAEISTVITEVVAAVEAWWRDHEASTADIADYATLRIYTESDDTVPDPDDEAGRALEAAIAATGSLHHPALYGGTARLAFAVGHLSAGEDADVACEVIERSLLRFLESPNSPTCRRQDTPNRDSLDLRELVHWHASEASGAAPLRREA